MNKTLTFAISLIILILYGNQVFSQSLKKAFKAFYENQDYTSSERVFKSSQYRSTCIGLFGQALVQHKKPYIYDDKVSSEKNLKNEIQKEKSAYSKILASEELIPGLDEKDLKNLKDYFSIQKISDLKKEIETYFLELDPSSFDKTFLADMSRISKRNDFFIALETKFVNYEFKKIKKGPVIHNNISATERLIENYPEYTNINKLHRYKDSLRFVQANTISLMSKLLNEYPDNQFKAEIFSKIKAINAEFQYGISKKNSKYKKIVVFDEADTEEEAVKILTDRYYNFYIQKKYSISDQYYYMILSDEDVKRFNLPKKYLLYTYCKLGDYNSLDNDVYSSKMQYKESYGLDLNNGLQIFSKKKVFKYGKELKDYTAIAVMLCGKYRFGNDEVSNTMKGIIEELKTKTQHQVLTYTSNADIHIFPDENPFSFKYDLNEVEGFDLYKNSITVVFLSSYKKTYLFEIDPDKLNEALDRIMYKIGFYFRD